MVELSINRHFDHRFRAASSLNWQPVMTTHLPMLTIPSQHTLCQNKPQLARLDIRVNMSLCLSSTYITSDLLSRKFRRINLPRSDISMHSLYCKITCSTATDAVRVALLDESNLARNSTCQADYTANLTHITYTHAAAPPP